MCTAAENTVKIASGSQVLTIAVYRGFSAAQIIALLNWHEASLDNGEIVGYVESNPTGYPMCRVLADNGELAGTTWSLAGDACCGSSGCGSCSSGCNCGDSCSCR